MKIFIRIYGVLLVLNLMLEVNINLNSHS